MGKSLGAKTKTTQIASARRRKRQKCRNSDKLLAILTIIACMLSLAPIFLHSHELHKNALKGSLDKFIQESNTKIKDAKGGRKKHDDKLLHEHPVAHLNCADHGGPTDPHIIDEMVYWVSHSLFGKKYTW